jgi:hypothetical protein
MVELQPSPAPDVQTVARLTKRTLATPGMGLAYSTESTELSMM